MARTISSTLTTAVGKAVTKPVYLLRFNIGGGLHVATWASAITWASEHNTDSPASWAASNIEVSRVDNERATLRAPLDDYWLGIVLTNAVRGTGIKILTYYEDTTASPQADAVLIFDGILDGADMGDDIRINCIELSAVKKFPPGRIDQPTFTYLPVSGTKIAWGKDSVTVN